MKGTVLKSIAVAALLIQCLIGPAQANFQPRIVGGIDVSIQLYPSTVAVLINSRLEFADPFYEAQSCGGTLIRPTWVITAAHCMFDNNGRLYQPSEISILAGTTDLRAPETTRTEVSRIINHPGYTQVVLGDDIALLELSEPAPAPVVVMNSNPLPANENIYIVGWGTKINLRADGSGNFPSILQGAVIPIRSTAECAALPGNYQFVNINTQICAGLLQGGIDSCQGDSGGPLYRENDEGILLLAGITSWGDGCAFANQPGIYTDVFAYRDWINGHIGSDIPPRIQEPEDPIPQAQASIDDRSSGSGIGATLLFLPLLLIWFRSRFLRESRH